ncbi:MAG: DUF86 domain-containing protein [Spirochaetia bacterium]
MTNETVSSKLESIGRCLERIVQHTPSSAEELASDYDVQDIVSINLQRAIQLAVDAAGAVIASHGFNSPSTMADAFRTLEKHNLLDNDTVERLVRAVGFRNVSVHEYQEIDWKIVFSIITMHLDDFRTFVRLVSEHL